MIPYIIALLVITASLIALPGSQLLPTILAQVNSMTESTTGNTTATITGNTTESEEDEELQQNGSISRKRGS